MSTTTSRWALGVALVAAVVGVCLFVIVAPDDETTPSTAGSPGQPPSAEPQVVDAPLGRSPSTDSLASAPAALSTPLEPAGTDHMPARLTVVTEHGCCPELTTTIELRHVAETRGRVETTVEPSLTWDDLRPGAYELEAAHDRLRFDYQMLRLEPGAEQRVTLAAPQPHTVRGQVLRLPRGEPVRAYTLTLQGSRGGSQERFKGYHHDLVEELEVRTEDGRFCVPLIQDGYDMAWRIQVSTDGGETVTMPWVDWWPNVPTRDLVVELPAVTGVRGRVLSPVGAVADAQVSLVRPDEGSVGFIDLDHDRADFDEPLARTRSDARGRFDLETSATGAASLLVRHPEHPVWRSSPFELPPAGESSEQDVQLEHGARLRVRVRWDELPLAQGWAQLSVVTLSKGSSGATSWQMSAEADGETLLSGLPAGRAHVMLMGFGDSHVPNVVRDVQLEAGVTADVLIDLDQLFRRPSLDVRLLRPEPPSDVRAAAVLGGILFVDAVALDGTPVGTAQSPGAGDVVRLVDVPPGPLVVRAYGLLGRPERAVALVEIPAQGSPPPVELDLRTPVLTLHAPSASDAAGEARRFHVEPLAPEGEPVHLMAPFLTRLSPNREDLCEVRGLPTGSYRVTCDAAPGVERTLTLGPNGATLRFD